MRSLAPQTGEFVYDPFSYRIHEDPYPVYAWMRDHAPLYRNAERGFSALSRYEDVLLALRDPALFSSRNGISLEPDLWGPTAVKTSFFLAMDPPDHGTMRRLLGTAFKPRWVAAMEPRVRELTRARLAPVRDGGPFDFADFAAAVPNDVMCDVVGIPAADRDRIRADNDLLNHCEDGTDERSGETVAAGLRLAVYYVNLIGERRKRPAGDLTSAMIEARAGGEPLTDSQLVAFLFLLVSAGNDSTGKLIGNAWYHGRRLPDVGRAGLNGRAEAWGAETLRYDSPSQMTARTLTRDIVVHGTRLREGERVALLPASANRDGRVFPDPDTFDLDRDTGKHIAFGHGPHFCLGAALARLEITVVLQEVGAVVSDYDIDLSAARRVHSPHQRGFASLPSEVALRPKPLPAV
ncbi:cytochrome P450 [Planomonospora sp. ID82291]|uniref:cytochrome P450 n=1 Tax=Planomonospora sp. ID82291 TaxID=2738136 RepID=UPI0018C391CE|nr:cytochrome P450 [Planomonospora sp. ID82291]MBG0816354.1 cytochrome P450 [Planomonospora sp. ID82291]